MKFFNVNNQSMQRTRLIMKLWGLITMISAGNIILYCLYNFVSVH